MLCLLAIKTNCCFSQCLQSVYTCEMLRRQSDSNLFLCSCSRRSCSSLSRCSRACLRFSARTRAASSGSLVPADGLLAGAAGVEAAAGAAGGAGLLTEAGAGVAAEAAGTTPGTATEAVDTTGGLREGGVTGAEDTTMAGTLLESAEEMRGDAFTYNKTNITLLNIWVTSTSGKKTMCFTPCVIRAPSLTSLCVIIYELLYFHTLQWRSEYFPACVWPDRQKPCCCWWGSEVQ